jgi:purine-binding chemotaxis protein CheW
MKDEPRSEPWLICDLGAQYCCLPLAAAIETLRPPPIEPLSGLPSFVLGVSIIRGRPLPVLDVALLTCGRSSNVRRLVTVAVDDRLVALAVENVVGVHFMAKGDAEMLPPLLQDAAGSMISSVRTLDSELLLLLDAARIVPEAFREDLFTIGGIG